MGVTRSETSNWGGSTNRRNLSEVLKEFSSFSSDRFVQSELKDSEEKLQWTHRPN